MPANTMPHGIAVLILVFVLALAVVLLIARDSRRAGRGPFHVTGVECPVCHSTDVERDSASPWIFVFAAALFPFGLILFALNRNVWCRGCGVRFKRPQKRSGWR